MSALTDLLNAQNDLLNVWVSYEVLRVLIEFEMGTMQINDQGVWLDPALGDDQVYHHLPNSQKVKVQQSSNEISEFPISHGISALENDFESPQPVVVELNVQP